MLAGYSERDRTCPCTVLGKTPEEGLYGEGWEFDLKIKQSRERGANAQAAGGCFAPGKWTRMPVWQFSHPWY